ncbi:nuclear transcription factor Y subunit B-3-like [Diospyros lotus]|uniref:nuclear transcription factor Y subunit B-3-like n=1 Tax=Diospyros lotus TaxID=55363 RepID=UPI002254736D|nr:nuclear transcription factor Y subunit B-3-like [Diospyros lotus]
MTRKRCQTGSPSSYITNSAAVVDNDDDGSSKEQLDRFLPIANVSRIMKKSLPGNAKISKEGKETVQECVSEFISFITGEASDKCQREKRKTINGDDLLWAMTTLGFDNYLAPLKLYLNKYRETEGERSSSYTPSRHVHVAPGYQHQNNISGGLSVNNLQGRRFMDDDNSIDAIKSYGNGNCNCNGNGDYHLVSSSTTTGALI